MIECVTCLVAWTPLSLQCVSDDVIILQDQFFHPSPPLTPNLMASLVALVYSIINFMIHLLQTHLFR